MHLTLATAANDGYSGAFGIGIASTAACTAGGGSVPTPITESVSDNWLYHQFFNLKAGFPFATGADPAGNRAAFLNIEVDSKAMRKFPPDSSIYASLEVAEVGTAGLEVFFDSRMLVKLA